MSVHISTAKTVDQISIPFCSVFIPDANIRRNLPDIPGLAKDLEEHGQITPIIVSNGGPKDRPWVLRAGYRRCAAFEYNGWQDREILATVREYAKDDLLSPYIDTWTENEERKGVSPVDKAQFIHQLVTGSYWVPSGQKAKPISREEISKSFRLTNSHIGRFLKIFSNIDPTVSDLARKSKAPLRLLIVLSNIEGEGENPIVKLKVRSERQIDVLQMWIDQKKELAEQGRERASRKDKNEDESGENEPPIDSEDSKDSPPLNPSRKIGLKKFSLHRPVKEYLTVLVSKQSGAKTDHDKAMYEGMLEAFRFLTGQSKKLPGITSNDFQQLYLKE